MLRFCRLASHKNNLIIYDFSVSGVLISSFCTSASDDYIEALEALGALGALAELETLGVLEALGTLETLETLETLAALENMRVESIVLLRFCHHYQYKRAVVTAALFL